MVPCSIAFRCADRCVPMRQTDGRDGCRFETTASCLFVFVVWGRLARVIGGPAMHMLLILARPYVTMTVRYRREGIQTGHTTPSTYVELSAAAAASHPSIHRLPAHLHRVLQHCLACIDAPASQGTPLGAPSPSPWSPQQNGTCIMMPHTSTYRRVVPRTWGAVTAPGWSFAAYLPDYVCTPVCAWAYL